jgi:hypothetical protein
VLVAAAPVCLGTLAIFCCCGCLADLSLPETLDCQEGVALDRQQCYECVGSVQLGSQSMQAATWRAVCTAKVAVQQYCLFHCRRVCTFHLQLHQMNKLHLFVILVVQVATVYGYSMLFGYSCGTPTSACNQRRFRCYGNFNVCRDYYCNACVPRRSVSCDSVMHACKVNWVTLRQLL